MPPREGRARDRAQPNKAPPPNETALRIALTLAQARKRLKFSQRELAERVGCHLNTIWRIEHGEPLALDLFFRYCEALGTDPKAMIGRMQRSIKDGQQ